jgi:hypothetical protein
VVENDGGKLEVELIADKVTKGAVRFMQAGAREDFPMSIYLRKPQVEALGLPVEEGAKILILVYAKP